MSGRMNNMHDRLKELVQNIPTQISDKIFLIAIDGCGGAGKSTVADELTLALGHSQIIHIDDFYKPKEKRVKVTEKTPVHVNFEFGRLKQDVLEPLQNGRIANYVTPKGEMVEIKPEGYVIVEGLGTLGVELKDSFDFRIWVDALETVRRRRGIERDSKAWTSIWDEEYLPQDARYIEEQSPDKQADWVLSNN